MNVMNKTFTFQKNNWLFLKLSAVHRPAIILAAFIIFSINCLAQRAGRTNPQLQFVGNANVQKSLTNGEDIPANTGIGVIYREDLGAEYMWLHDIEISLTINIASTVDTLKTKYDQTNYHIKNVSDFGNSVLLPSNSGQAFGFSFKCYVTKRDSVTTNGVIYRDWYRGRSAMAVVRIISGFCITFNGSNRYWTKGEIPDSISGVTSEKERTVKVANLALYAGIFHEFIARRQNIRDNYSITVGAGFSGRWIAGDISAESNDIFRKSIIGTDKTAFMGGEINVGMRLKNIKAEVRMPFLFCKDKVPGLTGVQPNTFIGFMGGFSLELN
jgi:hypothetical protein